MLKKNPRNQFLFYIPAMNNWNLKLKAIQFVLAPKKKEIYRYKSNKVCVRST